jgi:hypothetical protein
LGKDVSHHAVPVQSTRCLDITRKFFKSQTEDFGGSQCQQYANCPLCVAKLQQKLKEIC